MLAKAQLFARNKSSLALLSLALIVGGISAQASALLNTASGGYLVCVNAKSKVVTHPGTDKCPTGSGKLVLGARGEIGAPGLSGATGLPGKDGTNGKDGKTLWNGARDPENTWGAPGDMFINSATKTLFGPKDLTTGWPAGVLMVGANGAAGPAGAKGADGPSGPAGPGGSGPTGPTGAPGSNASLTCAQGGVCIVGNTGPGGGVVFYVQTATPSAPWRYMEAAPNTWSGGSSDPGMIWCSNTGANVASLSAAATAVVSTSTAIGKGFSNTRMMLGTCTYGAANAAAAYNGGGKSDWFLPSRDELNELHSARTTSGLIGGFVAGLAYWSSSEYDATKAYNRSFVDGTLYQAAKSDTDYVRPVRAF